MEFGGLSLSLKFEFQKTLPSLLTIEGSYVPAAEQRISAVGLTIYMIVVALITLMQHAACRSSAAASWAIAGL